MNKTELKQLLAKLQHQLNILQEREAKFGDSPSLALLNQIQDHQTGIEWVRRRLADEISDETLAEKLEPLVLELDRGGTEIIAGDKVIGDKNVIKIGTLTIPAVPLVILLLVVVATMAFLGFNFLGPTRMQGRFNVAVAEFGELGPAGTVQRSETGQRLSAWVFEELKAQNERYPAGSQVELWHDSLPITRKLASIGLVAGATPEDRAKAAGALADKIGADVIIYGQIDTGERPAFTLEFYVSPRLRSEADTTIGRYQLGEPLITPTNFDPEDVLSREAVAGPLTTRTSALFWLILGLKEDLLGHSEAALKIFRQAEEQLPTWKDRGEGKETLYFFIGRSALFLNRDVEAQQAFKKALDLKPDYARAQIALGSVFYKRAQCLLQDTAHQAEASCAELCRGGTEAGCVAQCREAPELCLDSVRQGLAQTIHDYQAGLDLAGTAGEPQVQFIARFALATAYLLKGQTHYYLHEDGEAGRLLDQALQETEAILPALTAAEQYRFLGQAYLTEGTAYTLKARILQDQGDTSGSAGLYQKARDAYARCIDQQQQAPYADQILIDQVVAACQASDNVAREGLQYVKGEP